MIDGHVHIVEADERYNGVFSFSIDDFKDRLNTIEGAVIMGMITDESNSLSINVNLIQKLKKIDRNKYYYFAFLHPKDITEEFIKRYKPDGIKFHPSISQTTINLLSEPLEIINNYGLPILLHCGRGDKSHIEYLLNINSSYPKINFIVAHLAGLATELILNSLQKFEHSDIQNIYLDTSGCFHPELIRRAVKIVGNKKIIYGTDTPFFDQKICKYVIESCEFDETTEENIFHNNILRALNRM